jgi:imidazolonepropionase-like amidohydrolase
MNIIAASVVLFIALTLCLIDKAQSSTRTVISGATVIDGAGRAPIKSAVIVIEGNRIKQIGTRNEINLPKNAQVHDAGILVVAGTDTGVPEVLLGPSSQTELVILVEDGLKVEDALRTATINAAKMLRREKGQGAVETGKLADLVILDADPLADIRNIRRIHRVLKAGVVYEPAELLRTTK